LHLILRRSVHGSGRARGLQGHALRWTILAGGVTPASKGKLTEYQANGMDAEAVRKCWTAGACACNRVKRGCHGAISLKELQRVCRLYWSLSNEERERSLLVR
jgi:hypothetical protein